MDKYTVCEAQTVLTGVVTFAGVITRGEYDNSVIQILTDNEYRPRYEVQLGKWQDMPSVTLGDRVRLTVWLGGGKSNPKTDKPKKGPFHSLRLAKCEVIEAQPRANAPAIDKADTDVPPLKDDDGESMPF